MHMILDYIIAALVFPALVILWVVVENIARKFALKHPELGPPRDPGGCGGCCGSDSKTSCHFPE